MLHGIIAYFVKQEKPHHFFCGRHIERIYKRLPRLQIQFRISRSFRSRNLVNLRSKIRFWIHRKEHTPYEKVLVELRSALRGDAFDKKDFVERMKLIDEIIIDQIEIKDKFEISYENKYKTPTN